MLESNHTNDQTTTNRITGTGGGFTTIPTKNWDIAKAPRTIHPIAQRPKNNMSKIGFRAGIVI